MNNVLEDSLFVSQNRKFDEIQSIVRQFSAEYVGNSIIKDNIFAVIQNYARKKEIALEMLRYPIHDDELWALTFLKQDTIFVCVNTALPLCKQFFAAAHELYHIYCYVENADQSYIKNGSMLDSATGDETGRTQEDLEANAFAGLLLMPDQLLHEQILLYGLDKDLVTVDSVLMLMDMFAMPYKAVVLRLFESGNISHQQAEKLLEVGSADVMERVSLTGKAKRWQLDGKGTESFGTLLEKVEYNRQHESGQKMRNIAKWLNEQGVEPPMKHKKRILGKPYDAEPDQWTTDMLRCLFRNPTYTGAAANGSRQIIAENCHEPYITKEQFQTFPCNMREDENKISIRKSYKKPKHRCTRGTNKIK